MFSLNTNTRKHLRRFYSFVFVLLWAMQAAFAQEGDAAQIAKGKELFSGNCASCHALSNKSMVGPGLQGISERRDEAWLIKWIRNSQAVIASGDAYAVALYNQYNKTVMQSFPDLSDDDIRAILTYVSAYVPPTATNTANAGGDAGAAGPADNTYLNVVLGALVVVLGLVLLVLVIITQLLTRFLQQREDLPEAEKELVNQRFDLGAVFQSKAFLTVVGVLFVLVVAKAGIDKVMNIGIQTGYAPTQPIAFSHKLHAGHYEIDCGYCHTSVYKGKSASIPAANICMNCHNQIKRTSPEIQKIYTAVENDQPIQWVRVHNLPDLAYFNHSQHTVAGGLECQNCHGEIEKMEVVQQRSPLTMGWCIDCHRKTVVKAEGNEYYDRLLAAHKADGLRASEIKVKDIGGLECSKCHY